MALVFEEPRILGAPDVARTLSTAYDDRLAWNYTEEVTSLRTARDLPGFVVAVERFFARVEEELARRRAWKNEKEGIPAPRVSRGAGVFVVRPQGSAGAP